jgi:hypothetical protein
MLARILTDPAIASVVWLAISMHRQPMQPSVQHGMWPAQTELRHVFAGLSHALDRAKTW